MNNNEIKELLLQVLANQVVIYKRLEDIEYKIKGGGRSAPIKTYIEELKKKADEALAHLKIPPSNL